MAIKTILVIICLGLIGCGIAGPRYIDYQAGYVAPSSTTEIALCPEATNKIASVFTSTTCSCHGTTRPNIATDAKVNRNAFRSIVQDSYGGDYDAFASYLQTDHSGSSSVTGSIALEIDSWGQTEQNDCT